MNEFFKDDKNVVVIAVLILGLSIIFSAPLDAETSKIMNAVFTGLFGVAVGRASK